MFYGKIRQASAGIELTVGAERSSGAGLTAASAVQTLACGWCIRQGLACPQYETEYHSHAVAGHTLGTPTKPDPHLVNEMRAAFGLAPGGVLYVGDSGVDIETAHNARLAGCGVLWGFRTEAELRAAGAQFLVHTPAELAALVLEGGPAKG